MQRAALLSSVNGSMLSNGSAYVSTQLVSQFRYARRLILSFYSELYKLWRICGEGPAARLLLPPGIIHHQRLPVENTVAGWFMAGSDQAPPSVSGNPVCRNRASPPGEPVHFVCGIELGSHALLSVLPKIRDIEPDRPDRPNLPVWVETALFGSVANLRALLDAGLDPNAATKEGTSVLMFSVNDARKVRLLLERGADVNHKAQSGATALFVAANLRGNIDAFSLLLNAGADVNVTAANGGTVLGVAITGEAEKVVLLLGKGTDPNRRLVHGGVVALYPLQLAVTSGDGEIVDLLVSHGAAMNRQIPAGFVLTPLSVAVNDDNLAMVKLLISLGADVNQRDSLGMTPLLWSAIWDYGRDDVTQALLDAGAEPGAREPSKGYIFPPELRSLGLHDL
jgi:ankyrin repeat protein